MATISVTLPDGTAQTVTADPGFDALSDSEKQAALGRLSAALMASRPSSAAPPQAQPAAPIDPSGATSGPQGNTGAQGVPNPPDTSYGSALRYGAHNAAEGLGATLGLASALPDGTPGADTLASAAQWLKGAIAPPTNYQPAGPDVISALRSGDYAGALAKLPRAATENAADLAATVGAGVMGGGVGAAAYQAVRNLGDNAQARAANNGDATPTPGDIAGAIPGTAAQALLGAVGIGRAPGVSGLIDSSPALLRPLTKAVTEGVASAASDQAGQLGNTMGTASGLQDDPYQSAAAGLQGAAGRLAGEVPGAVRGAVKAGVDGAVASTLPMPDPEQAASNVRVGAMLDNARSGSEAFGGSGRPVPDTAALNNVKSTLVSGLNAAARSFRSSGLLGPDDFVVIKTAIDQAQRHNNTLTEGAPGGVPTIFDQVQDLDLPADARVALVNGLRDLNTVSTQSFLKNQQGPFQAAGRFIGAAGSAAAGLASGHPVGAALGLIDALGGGVGHGIGGKIGAAVGSGLDAAFGTATPTVVLQRARSQRILNRLGADPGANPLEALPDAVATYGSPSASLQAQLARAKAAAAMMPNAAPATTAADAVSDAYRTAQAKLAMAGVGAGVGAGPGTAPVAPQGPDAAPMTAPGATNTAPLVSAVNARAALTQAQNGGASVPPISNAGPPRGGDVISHAGAPPLVDPSASPGDPSASPAAPPPGLGFATGWKAYVQQGLKDHGIDATVSDIHRAVGDLLDNGGLAGAKDATGQPLFNPATLANDAAALVMHGGRLDGDGGRAVMNLIAGQVALNKGKLSHLDPNAGRNAMPPGWPQGGAGDATAQPSRPPVRDPLRWHAARQDIKDHVESVAKSVQAADPDLAAVVRRVGASKAAIEKQRIAADHAASVGSDPVRSAMARRVLQGPMMRGV